MPPSSEQLVTLKQAFNAIDSLPDCEDIHHRIMLMTRFYITYSHSKPKFDTPELFQQVVRESAAGTRTSRSIAQEHDAHVSTLINMWGSMHMILTMALTHDELAAIGLPAATMNDQGLHTLEVFHRYQNAITNIRNTPEIEVELFFNSHYEQFLQALADGKGVNGFLEEYVGSGYTKYFSRIDQVERSFKNGLEGVTRDPTDRGFSSYNNSFLRRAVIARFLESGSASTTNTYIPKEHILHYLRLVLNWGPTGNEYISILQEFIEQLAYYESTLPLHTKYKMHVRMLSTDGYLKLYSEHVLMPFPITYILKQEANDVSQADIAADLVNQGIAYAHGTLRNQISAIAKFMECVLLIPDAGLISSQSLYEVLTRSHKQDVAIITSAAAGKLEAEV